MTFSEDHTLGIDYNTELTIGRAGRTWEYNASSSSVSYGVGLNASIGWNWVKYSDPDYGSVSNPNTGFWYNLHIDTGRYGLFYINRYDVTSYTFGEPKTMASRSANARAGYRIELDNCLVVDVFGEKRSYHFAAFEIPDLYTKTKRIGISPGCQW